MIKEIALTIIKMNNKKGWMRIMEATIAVMIVSGVMVSVYSSQSSRGAGSEEYYEGLQKDVMLDISSRSDLRNDVLSGETANLIIFTDNNIPTSLDYFLKICPLGEVCKMDENVFISTIDRNVYVEETIISSNVTEYNPSVFTFFIWDVPVDYMFCGDGVCNAGSGEVCGGCIKDCGVCNGSDLCPGLTDGCDVNEDCLNCPSQCTSCDLSECNNNGRCSGLENPVNCEADCGVLDEGVCSPSCDFEGTVCGEEVEDGCEGVCVGVGTKCSAGSSCVEATGSWDCILDVELECTVDGDCTDGEVCNDAGECEIAVADLYVETEIGDARYCTINEIESTCIDYTFTIGDHNNVGVKIYKAESCWSVEGSCNEYPQDPSLTLPYSRVSITPADSIYPGNVLTWKFYTRDDNNDEQSILFNINFP